MITIVSVPAVTLPLPFRWRRLFRPALLATSLALAAFPARAGVKHWQGDVNGNWGTAGNWLENAVPANGDELNFLAATRFTMTNNLTGLRLDRIAFTSGGYLLRGQGVTLTNGLYSAPPGGTAGNELGIDLTLGASQSIRCDRTNLYLTGQIILGPHKLTVTNAVGTQILIGGWAGAGLISGTGAVVKEGAGVLDFWGWSTANTYSGTTHVKNGTVLLGRTSVPSIPGPGILLIGDGVGAAGSAVVRYYASSEQIGTMAVTLNADGLLDLAGFSDAIGGTLTLNGGDITLGAGTLTLGGDVSVLSSSSVINGPGGAVSLPATRNFGVASGVVFDLQAPVTGDGGLAKRGPGQMRLSYSGSFLGVTTVAEGELDARATGALGSGKNGTVVAKGAGLVLNAVGVFTSESLTLNGDGFEGFGALTTGGSTGTTTWAAPVTLESDSSLMTLMSTAVLEFSGAVIGAGCLTKLGAGTLVFSGAADNTYSGDTVVTVGTLELRKTGAARAVFYGSLRIGDGAGGDRADVVRLRGSSGDQIRDTVPVVIASSGLLDLDYVNETVGPLTLNGGDIILADSTLNLGGDLAVSAASVVTNRIGAGVSLPATRTVTVAEGSSLNVAAPMAGAGGITKAGLGILQLSAHNTYSGLTVVQQGILQPRHSDALGTSAGGTVVSNGASLVFVGPLSIANEALTLDGGGYPGYGALDSEANPGTNTWGGRIYLNGDCAISPRWPATWIRLTGPIDGPGTLRLFGGGTLHLNSSEPNTYQGATTVESGTLLLCNYSSDGAIRGDLLISGTVRLDWNEQINSNATVTIYSSGTLDLYGFNENLGTLSGSGQVNLSSGRLYAGCNHASSTFSGVISGSGLFHKAGHGTLTLSANNTYSGGTYVDAGTLLVNGSQPRSAVTVEAGATLGGKGTVGNLVVNGTLSPGASPGTLNCSNLTFASTGNYVVELRGTTARLGYDQVRANGTVRLGNANLLASLGFASAVGNTYTIVYNSPGTPIIGTFAGLGDPSLLILSGNMFRIDYYGGSWQDVTLTHVQRPSLRIVPFNRTNVVVSWPAVYTGFTLEARTNVTTGAWLPVTPAPVLSGTNYILTNTASGSQKYYRLRLP